MISQASSAITVVSQRPEQHGTMQHIEAEKLLLVATQKRQSALHEIQVGFGCLQILVFVLTKMQPGRAVAGLIEAI